MIRQFTDFGLCAGLRAGSRLVLAAVVSTAALTLSACSHFPLGGNDEGRQLVLENSWSRDTTKKNYLGFRRMNRMTPLVSGDILIEANAVDGLLAYNRKTGVQLWRLDLRGGVEGGGQIAGEKFYFGSSDGTFYCASVETGKVDWTFSVRAETLAAPTVEAGVVYFQSGADIVFALDASTGKQLWVYNRQVNGSLSIRATTRPVVAGEQLLVGFSDGYFVSLKKRDGTLMWEKKLGKSNRFRDVDATPVVDGTNVYVASFDAALYSLELESGEINWMIEGGGYLPVTVGQGAFSGELFYATADGKILVVDKTNGKLARSIEIAHGIATQPVLYKSYLIYGESEGAFVVASASNGKAIAKFYPGDGIVAQPALIESTGEAYFISTAANVYALRFNYFRPSERLPWQEKPRSL